MLLVGAKSDGGYFARVDGRPGVFYLKAAVVEELLAPQKIFAKEISRPEPAGERTTDIEIKMNSPAQPQEQ